MFQCMVTCCAHTIGRSKCKYSHNGRQTVYDDTRPALFPSCCFASFHTKTPTVDLLSEEKAGPPPCHRLRREGPPEGERETAEQVNRDRRLEQLTVVDFEAVVAINHLHELGNEGRNRLGSPHLLHAAGQQLVFHVLLRVLV